MNYYMVPAMTYFAIIMDLFEKINFTVITNFILIESFRIIIIIMDVFFESHFFKC